MKCEVCGNKHDGEFVKVSEFEGKKYCDQCLIYHISMTHTNINLSWKR